MADKEYRTSSLEATMSTAAQPRPKIAFFDYPDVFEDFYPHYDVDQRAFATIWANSGNHAFIKLLQRDIGDVTWYALSLSPAVPDSHHAETGFIGSCGEHSTYRASRGAGGRRIPSTQP
jgi:hypothetical protein